MPLEADRPESALSTWKILNLCEYQLLHLQDEGYNAYFVQVGNSDYS